MYIPHILLIKPTVFRNYSDPFVWPIYPDVKLCFSLSQEGIKHSQSFPHQRQPFGDAVKFFSVTSIRLANSRHRPLKVSAGRILYRSGHLWDPAAGCARGWVELGGMWGERGEGRWARRLSSVVVVWWGGVPDDPSHTQESLKTLSAVAAHLCLLLFMAGRGGWRRDGGQQGWCFTLFGCRVSTPRPPTPLRNPLLFICTHTHTHTQHLTVGRRVQPLLWHLGGLSATSVPTIPPRPSRILLRLRRFAIPSLLIRVSRPLSEWPPSLLPSCLVLDKRALGIVQNNHHQMCSDLLLLLLPCLSCRPHNSFLPPTRSALARLCCSDQTP